MSADNELKPCPFCGSKDVMVYESENMYGQASDWVVRCMDGLLYGGCGNSIIRLKRNRVIEAWNRRPEQSPWTTIAPGDAGTLPKRRQHVIFSYLDDEGEPANEDGYFDDGYWHGRNSRGYYLAHKPYAWMPWPDPAAPVQGLDGGEEMR